MEKPELSDQRSERKLPPLPKAAPWLVFPHGEDKKFQTFYNLCDPKSRSCTKFIPELSKNSFWQKNCHQGWLVILCDDKKALNCNYGNCFLWNPSSIETLQLPSMRYWMELDGYEIQDCVLSSPPTGKNDDESMVFFLFHRAGVTYEYVIVYCSVGDTEWCKRMFIDKSPCSIDCFSGKIYAMCMNNPHLEIEIQHGSGISSDKALSISEFNLTNNSPYTPGLEESNFSPYYVQSCGEIFKIDIFGNPRGVYREVFAVNIWKMNLSLSTLEEVKSLDDHVFFLGKNTVLSCSAAELGFTKGCVYFTQPDEMSLYKYEVDDSSMLSSLPCPELPSPWFSSNWMMIPTNLRDAVSIQKPRYTKCKKDEEDSSRKEEESEIVENEEDDPRQKQNGGELKEAMDWGNLLPDDLLCLLGNYLHTLDYIHWRAVSKSQQSIIPRNGNIFSNNRNVRTDLSPWLVFSDDNLATYNFLNPLHNEKYLLNIPELLKGANIRSSKGGWLLISRGSRCFFFYNPFTRATIKLPDLPDDKEYVYSVISFSSVPTASDCSIIGVSTFLDDVVIMSISRGDESWSLNMLDNYVPPDRKDVLFKLSLNYPVFYQRAFYFLDCNGLLGVYDGNINSWEILVKVPPPNLNFIYKSFLVECGGELLSVFLGHFGNWVRVFKLDMSESVWIEVKHLGESMLCISRTSCISAVAPNCRMKNKIYFPRLHNAEILFFSLETGTYNSFSTRSSPSDFYESTEYLSCSWIEPNWAETTDQGLDWHSNQF